jgi:predicted Zn-dependent peptidase
MENFSDRGYLRFEFSSNQKDIVRAGELFSYEIQQVIDGNIDNESFDASKASFITNLTRYYLDPKNILWFYGWRLSLGVELITLEEYMHELEQVSPQQLAETARKVFQKNHQSIAAIGNSDCENFVAKSLQQHG